MRTAKLGGRSLARRSRGDHVDEVSFESLDARAGRAAPVRAVFAVEDDLSRLDVALLLADLLPRYRAIVACLGSGLNQRETAALLGISESRLHVLLDRVRDALAPPSPPARPRSSSG